MTISASAPAKIILFGEHAAVYGKPALAVPLPDLRVTATVLPHIKQKSGLWIHALDLGQEIVIEDVETVLRQDTPHPLALAAALILQMLGKPTPEVFIQIESQIPIASGLGSGAAISAAVVRSLAKLFDIALDLAVINEIVYQTEKFFHGNPSGIDNSVIVYERAVYFIREQPLEFIHIAAPFELVIADTGVRAPTHIAIRRVRELYDSNMPLVSAVLDEIGAIAVQARQIIETGQTEALGVLMSRNHVLLQQLAVSSPELDMLVDAALAAGAVGAKLSGGGMGGNMIALVSQDNRERVLAELRRTGAVHVLSAVVGGEG
jgi:mevalonate kinase